MTWQPGIYMRDITLSKDAAAHPWIATCHRTHCYFTVCAYTEEDAHVKLALHFCPHKGGPTKFGLLMPKTLLEKAWDELDEVVAQIMDLDPDDPNRPVLRAEARGIATVLAIFMVPHFTEPHEISQEAARRYKAKQEGDLAYETKGLGKRSTEAPAGDNKYQRPTPVVTTGNLDEKSKTAIRFAAANNFTDEQLAKTYGVSVAVIQAVKNEKAG